MSAKLIRIGKELDPLAGEIEAAIPRAVAVSHLPQGATPAELVALAVEMALFYEDSLQPIRGRTYPFRPSRRRVDRREVTPGAVQVGAKLDRYAGTIAWVLYRAHKLAWKRMRETWQERQIIRYVVFAVEKYLLQFPVHG